MIWLIWIYVGAILVILFIQGAKLGRLEDRIKDMDERIDLNKENMARSTQTITREIRRRK